LDVIEIIQPDALAAEDSTTEDKGEPDDQIYHTPANIETSSPESTYREHRGPWAPLITLTNTYTPTPLTPGCSGPPPLRKQL
jgi:hypothetical protein